MSTVVVIPKKIDALKPINHVNYSQWKNQLLNFLNTREKFISFLDPGSTWTCLYDDPNRNQTGEDIKRLESMMITLARYGPASLSDEILNFCTSIKYYFDIICKFFCIKSSPTTTFLYNRKRKGFKHDSNQSYQNFYLDLRATRYQVLMNEDSSVEVASDVMMPLVIEKGVIVDWLEGIDERLLDFVEEKYAQQLQTCTLYDIQNEISQHIDSFLEDLATLKKTDIKRDVKDDLLLMLASNENKLVKNENTCDTNLWWDKVKSLCSLSDDDIENVDTIRHKVKKFVSDLPYPTQMHNPNRLKSFDCDICGRLFKEKNLLKLHKKIHKEMQDFKCDKCSKTFTTKQSLKHHKVTHTGIKPFMCDQCAVTFTKKVTFKNHKLKHTGEKPFQCDVCEKQFRSGLDMRTHKKRTHGAKTKLNKNGVLPPNVKTENFMCDLCSRTFTEKRYLMVHQFNQSYCSGNWKKARKKLEKTRMCDICPKGFRLENELIVHKMTHTGERPFTCFECGKGFKVPSALNDHKRIHSGEKPFMCDKCPKAFISKNSLNHHKASHFNVFPCNICQKSFNYKCELARHKTVHDDTGQRPFVCDKCGKGFRIIEILRQHKQIHKVQKPFQCEQCSKSFRTRLNFLRHKLIHSGEKPFKCDKCDEAFRHSHVLKAHKMIHTEGSEEL